MTDLSHIRNFSIIAHIDHGKSTIADRFIQVCGGLAQREMAEQVLDSMDIERERGITIKAQSVTLNYTAKNGETYQLNFIDTPGHVDFSYEVSRSLAACEGALLVVDAAQGVEAQSVANCYTAIEQGLEVLPVLNKIDLPSADPDRVVTEIEEIIGIEASEALHVSAKTGLGIADLLESLVEHIPPPKGDAEAPLQALIIDSWFDSYVGVFSLIRVVNGVIRPKDKMRIMSSGRVYQVEKVGVFTPKRLDKAQLSTGEVGFVIAGIKDVDGAPANALPGQVPEEVKEERYARLMAHQQAISAEVLGARVGETLEVIVDDVDSQGAIARSHWDAPEIDGNVFIEDCEGLEPGDRLLATVTDASEYDLWASPLRQPAGTDA